MSQKPDRLALVKDLEAPLRVSDSPRYDHLYPNLRVLPDATPVPRFDPEETIPLESNRRQNLLLTLLMMTVLAGGGFWLGTMYHRLSSDVQSSPEPAAPVPIGRVADAAAPAVPKAEALAALPVPPPQPAEPNAIPYAFELACAYSQGEMPSPEIVKEFDALFRKAQMFYGRSTDLQIRDAVYSISALQAYNRPDLNPLTALRLIVDWLPAGRVAEAANMPVSEAAGAIAQDVIAPYNEAIQARWDAYYAQKFRIAENIQRARIQARIQAEADALRLEEVRTRYALLGEQQAQQRRLANQARMAAIARLRR